MAGIFEYIFSLPFYNFLNIIEKTWEKHHSLDNISTADLPDELNASLNTFKAIVEKSSKRINELESKSGYSEEYYRLITTISHQLRTPTTGLRWALESLRDDMTKEKPIDKSLVNDAYEASGRILEIIEELLVGVNEKSGARNYVAVDIEQGIESVLKESTLLARERRLTVVVNKKTKLIPLVKGIAHEIRFVLHSLISNALNYSTPGNVVTITMDVNGAFARVIVHNVGIGIKDSESAMLFAQFNRGEEAIRLNPNGSGMGLYLAREIVVGSGGNISYSSDKSGTSFTINFPLSDKGQLETSIHF